MLKKPYIKFYTKDNNNYYLLNTGKTFYLAIESVLRYKKGWLFKRDKEMQQALKLMPLYTPVVSTLLNLIRQDKIDEKRMVEDDKNSPVEEIYNTIDINEIRKKIAEMTGEIHDESKFNFKKSIKAPTLRHFMEEGDFKYLMKLELDSFKSDYWVTKSNKYGKLTFHQVTTAGRTEEKVMIINSYFLDRPLIAKLLITLKREQMKERKRELKALKKLKKEKRKELKELKKLKKESE